MCKATHIDNYPTKIKLLRDNQNSMNTRAMSNGDIEVDGHSTITHEKFINDATRAWNKALTQ